MSSGVSLLRPEQEVEQRARAAHVDLAEGFDGDYLSILHVVALGAAVVGVAVSIPQPGRHRLAAIGLDDDVEARTRAGARQVLHVLELGLLDRDIVLVVGGKPAENGPLASGFG